jgi:hypothetical protein
LLDEPDEQFVVSLSSPVNANLATSQADVTIIDDDPAPEISVADVTVLEGNQGPTQAVFEVTLSAPSGQSVIVDFATASGSADDADFVPTSGRLTFQPGEVLLRVTVAVQGDVDVEQDESFSLVLANTSGATVARGTATATITNDDAPPPPFDLSDFPEVLEVRPPQTVPQTASDLPAPSPADPAARRRLALFLPSPVGMGLSELRSGGGGIVAKGRRGGGGGGAGAGEGEQALVNLGLLDFGRRRTAVDKEIEALLKDLADAEQPRLLAVDAGDEVLRKKPVRQQVAKAPVAEPPARIYIPPPPSEVAGQAPWMKNLWWMALVPLSALLAGLGWYYRRRAWTTAGVAASREEDK